MTCVDDHEWHLTFQPTKQPGKKVSNFSVCVRQPYNFR